METDMSVNKPATTTLSPDDNATSQCESATVMSTTTLTKNQSLQNFKGTCTAKFKKDGEEVMPDFNGKEFTVNYETLFPKRINLIHITDPGAPTDPRRYINFYIIPARGNGTYPIPLTNDNASFIYDRHGFKVDAGELIINVDNGNCSGTFNLTVTGNPSGGSYETLNIVEGEFDIKAV
jgi:hypothetical protein